MALPRPVRDPALVDWAVLLVTSYRALTGHDLGGVVAVPHGATTALELFEAPAVVLSHGTEDDPVLNYANAAALRRWACTWPEFVGMPSRTTAEPSERVARAEAFDRMRATGWSDDYSGIRVDRSGQRFEIVGAVIWEVRDAAGNHLGDAATFSQSRDLPTGVAGGAY